MSTAAFAKESEALEVMGKALEAARAKPRPMLVNASELARRAVAILSAWDKEGDPQQWDEFRIRLAADVAVQIERAAVEAVEKETSK